MTKPEFQSVGGVETSSMARGFAVTDAMLKAADVKLLVSRTVCPGKFIALVAGRVASALRARRLVYMSDVPGLLSNPPDPESLISTLKISQVDDLKKKGVIDKGMRPKVQSAIRALQEGVQRVHFIDGRLAHSLLLEMFTDTGIGTEIVQG